jgi:Flp pilus assembly protein TadD
VGFETGWIAFAMPTIAEALMSAVRCQQAGQLQEAANIYRQIVAIDPSNVDAWHLLGVAACQVGELDLAVKCITRAIQLAPNYADAHNSLGLVLKELGRLDEATASCRRAVELNPAIAAAHYNLGNILQSHGKLEEAAACHRRALKLNPGDAAAHNNLGNALRDLGIFDEAASCFHEALTLNPTSFEFHLNQASLFLLRGDFGRGWQEYEWRWKAGLMPPRDYGKPLWDGGALQGETILLHGEQGFGDTLQFIRYASLVKGRGATVLVEEQAKLIPLLSNCPGIDRLIASGDKLPLFDVHLPLLSLPRIFQTTLETIPADVPYLFADSALVARWRDALSAVCGFRIGINWHGREGQGEFRKRDIPLELFFSLAQIPGVRLISLQKGARRQELAEAAHDKPIFDPGEEMDTASGAFTDTAAIMMNLDLVITSDTAIPHLAGALGVPVWLALPFVPSWHWLLDRSDSPWYPTMRLFRQKRSGDWDGVFAEIQVALRGLVAAG